MNLARLGSAWPAVWTVAAVLAAGCPSKQAPAGGSNPHGGNGAAACERIRPKVERLYRADAEAREPKRVDEAVADNTAMVMSDCAKEPGRVVGCVEAVATAADLEHSCLIPLDEEGTEGEALQRGAR